MRTIQEASRTQGNFIVEYSYIGRIDAKRTPMTGYYRCWAETPEAAAERFMHTQRYYRNDCCSVLQVWRRAEMES